MIASTNLMKQDSILSNKHAITNWYNIRTKKLINVYSLKTVYDNK